MFLDSHRLVIGGPADTVAAVPYLLGFHPQESLVLIGARADGTFAVRVDLPEPADYGSVVLRLLALMVHNAADSALLVAYGPEERATPVLKEVQEALSDIVRVKAVLRVDDGRWWALDCDNPTCCDPNGTAYDITTSTVAAQATLAGIMPFADRDQMAATLNPVEGDERVRMVQATRRAEAELLTDRRDHKRMVSTGLRLVRDLISREGDLTHDEIARLSVVCTHLRVRDEAWVRTADRDLRQQVALWRQVTVRAIGEYVAAPATLLAYVAYLTGDGGLANVALCRAEDAVPGYSMAELIRQCLDTGIPPQRIRKLMTPEALADAYDELEACGEA